MKGDFSFDALFGNLVNELLSSFLEEDDDSLEGYSNISWNDALSNGRSTQGLSSPLLPEIDALLSMSRKFKAEEWLIFFIYQASNNKCRRLSHVTLSETAKHQLSLRFSNLLRRLGMSHLKHVPSRSVH
ncbi:hypothetical protein L6452_09376 [Arctium lappa]|uniref:Uncharacterized protein n=1 Tax=Arctium lappa TaxID=4217 RepID=A0ACB9DJU4_ARCLA|nr:hypothetical protein L6452_09376 [Arctium lappa]